MLLHHPSIYILAQFHHRLEGRWHWGWGEISWLPHVVWHIPTHCGTPTHCPPPMTSTLHSTSALAQSHYLLPMVCCSLNETEVIHRDGNITLLLPFLRLCQFYYAFSGDHGTQNLLLRGLVLQWETRSRVWALVVRRAVNRPKRCQVFILVAVGARRLVKLAVGSGTGTCGYYF